MNQTKKNDIKAILAIIQNHSQFLTSISGMGYNCVTESDWQKVAQDVADYIEQQEKILLSDINREEGTNVH